MELIFLIFISSLVFLLIILEIRDWRISARERRESKQRELGEDVLSWCMTLYPIRKKRPRLVFDQGKSKARGSYSFSQNKIIVFSRYNVIQRELVDTVIHEYFHFYLVTSDSKINLYYKQLSEYGHQNHPQEILCNTMAKELAKRYLKEKK